MIASYDWLINKLEITSADGDLPNAVHTIHWRLYGTDGTNTSTVYGSIVLPPPSPNNFVPYEALSQGRVVEWLEDAIDDRTNDQTVAQLQTGLAQALEAKNSPKSITIDPPWLRTRTPVRGRP